MNQPDLAAVCLYLRTRANALHLSEQTRDEAVLCQTAADMVQRGAVRGDQIRVAVDALTAMAVDGNLDAAAALEHIRRFR